MPTTEALPRIVGRYALFEAIASGGMATVHLGRLMGPVGFSRTVAIKRLHENFARDPEFVTMFLDEARLAARIRHPNVVPTLDVVASEGELLLVMEYVAGAPLSQLLKQAAVRGTRAPIQVVADIMISVLHGLHAAHEATNEKGEPLHIVHRDVSPQNVMVGTDGVARVLDFGVAKAVGQTHQTRAGQFKGKLRYTAPEQLTGKGVDRRTDVYAAGLVLWEAVTGQRVALGKTDGEVVYSILQRDVPPPSELRQGVPKELDAVVRRALQKNPEDRYPTALAMAAALERAAPPTMRGAVAEWLNEIAGDDIGQRTQRVAAIESSTALEVVTPEALAALEARGSFPDTLMSTTASGSLSLIRVHSAAYSPRSRRIAVTGAALLVAGVAVSVLVSGKAVAPARARPEPTVHLSARPEPSVTRSIAVPVAPSVSRAPAVPSARPSRAAALPPAVTNEPTENGSTNPGSGEGSDRPKRSAKAPAPAVRAARTRTKPTLARESIPDSLYRRD